VRHVELFRLVRRLHRAVRLVGRIDAGGLVRLVGETIPALGSVENGGGQVLAGWAFGRRRIFVRERLRMSPLIDGSHGTVEYLISQPVVLCCVYLKLRDQ
jgi:hypothetical protein